MRPRKHRLVRSSPATRFYKPRGIPMREMEIVRLKDEEWEALLLADYRRLQQEEAARLMGVSRPTFSRVLGSARRAVAKALAEGAALEIGGGDFRMVSDENEKDKKEENMKIAFTTSGGELDSPMDERFGRCASFLIFDPADGNCTAIANENCDAAGGAGIKAAETVSRAGANAVVTGECGPKASMALRQAGIRVYSFRGGSVREALELFLAGALPEAK